VYVFTSQFICTDYQYATDGSPSDTVGVIASGGTTHTPTTDTGVVASMFLNYIITYVAIVINCYFTLVSYISSYVLFNS